jgi:uncharacterized membrane protein
MRSGEKPDCGWCACGRHERHAREGPDTVGVQRISPAGDRGSILPLVAGFGALCLALVLVVASATSLYLERKRLFTIADAAALAGAEAFELDAATAGPSLSSAGVGAAVAQYLATAPAGFEGLRVEHAEALDATSATVTLSSLWRPPVVSVFVPDGIRIEVTAIGRTVFF